MHRIHKNVKEVSTYVCMLPDYCSLPQSLKSIPTCGPDLSIEIKPKQGFVKKQYLLSSSQSPSLPICTYCVMQKYKLKSGKISSKSKYCPSDLFSGCYDRMLHALKMLLEAPQNNLRIFKNQNLVYSEENKEDLDELLSDFSPSKNIRSLDHFCDLIIQALVKPFPLGLDKTPVTFQKKFYHNCINACTIYCKHDYTCQLPQYCVLERILSCQMLDDLKITELYQLYFLHKRISDKHSNSIGCYSRSEIPPYLGEQRKNANESEIEYASRKVWEFLVALTSKDCSIMITIKQLLPISSTQEHSQNIISDNYGNSYLFSIAIADLDSKSVTKVEKVHNDFRIMLELVDIEHDFKE